MCLRDLQWSLMAGFEKNTLGPNLRSVCQHLHHFGVDPTPHGQIIGKK